MDRKALKALIHSKGLTYKQLGAEIGISVSGVEAIVSGRSQGATARYALASALGMTVEQIWPTTLGMPVLTPEPEEEKPVPHVEVRMREANTVEVDPFLAHRSGAFVVVTLADRTKIYVDHTSTDNTRQLAHALLAAADMVDRANRKAAAVDIRTLAPDPEARAG